MSGQEIIVAIIVGAAAASLLWRFIKFFNFTKNAKSDVACGKNDCDC